MKGIKKEAVITYMSKYWNDLLFQVCTNNNFESILLTTALVSPSLLEENRGLKVLSGCASHHYPQDGAPEARS